VACFKISRNLRGGSEGNHEIRQPTLRQRFETSTFEYEAKSIDRDVPYCILGIRDSFPGYNGRSVKRHIVPRISPCVELYSSFLARCLFTYTIFPFVWFLPVFYKY